MIIRTVLADDEVLARQKLRQVLKEIGDVEVVGECATAHETIELARLTRPDLLFLDIRMPDMDGFDVVDALSSIPEGIRPQVVLVTANDQFAVRAFEVQAIDYVLKPFTIERLRIAVERVRERRLTAADARSISKSSNETVMSTTPEGPNTPERYANRLVFKSRGRILFLPMNEIRWIEAEENYVRIRTASESHLLRETIGHLERRLDPQSFLRVHRSAIVNLQYVKEVKNEPDGDARVVLMNGETISMSRSYRARMHKLLKV